MKRQSILVFLATLFLCLGSSSARADFMDINIGVWEYDVSQGLELEYDDVYYSNNQSDLCGAFSGDGSVQYSIPYSDENIDTYVSSYVGIHRTIHGFTIGHSIEFSSALLQPIDDLYISSGAWSYINAEWRVSADALLKIKINGAVWNEKIDPYFALYIENGFGPLEFDYDGIYYTTYVKRDFSYQVQSSLSDWGSTDFARDCEIHCTFQPVPVPGAALLGVIGLAVSGWRLRRKTA
jgi:hypothetical protein